MWIALLLDLRLGGIIDVMEQNTNGNKTATLDDLALMIGKGFNEVHEKFDKVDERFDGLEGRMDKLEGGMDNLEKKVDDGFLRANARFDTIEMRIQDLDVISRIEFDDLMERVKFIEMKLGIISGK